MGQAETLGTRLRARRRAEGLTLADVAKRAELSLPYVSNLERGRGNPTMEALQALAQALGTTVSALVGDDESADFDPFELVMAEAPKTLIAFSRSSRFTDQISKLAKQQGVQEDELKRRVLIGMATSPRRSTGEPTEYDWLRLMDAYSRILEDG